MKGGGIMGYKYDILKMIGWIITTLLIIMLVFVLAGGR